MKNRVDALIVADAGPASSALVAALEGDVGICVVAQASSPAAVVRTVAQYRPDIVVLDLGVAHGVGHEIVADIMNRAPTPVLVLSEGIADRTSPSAVDALGAGALDVLPLPTEWTPVLGTALRDAVRKLSRAWVIRHLRGVTVDNPQSRGVPAGRGPVVAMAASTGGPSAFASVLAKLGGLPATVLLVQHLHPEFAGSLLDWMKRVSAMPVEFGSSGARIQPGRAYLAPPGVHMRLGKHGLLELDAQPATVHRPSADVLFTSVAEQAGASGIGVLLTGMGDDGARGLLAMRRSGARTIVQDEPTCAVFGMPRAAFRIGAAADVRPLDQVAAAVQRAARSLRGEVA